MSVCMIKKGYFVVTSVEPYNLPIVACQHEMDQMFKGSLKCTLVGTSFEKCFLSPTGIIIWAMPC